MSDDDDDTNEGIGVDLIFGGPDVPQPDWRQEDDEDDDDDDDDPEPIGPQFLEEVLGFDPDEEFGDEDEDEDDEDDDDDDDDEEFDDEDEPELDEDETDAA